jgi:hypothetical protein
MTKIVIEKVNGENINIETEQSFREYIKTVNASQLCFDKGDNPIPLCHIEKIVEKR